jgi:hypothetical protein
MRRKAPVRIKLSALATVATIAAFAAETHFARADEGGVSFWLPGEFGSLIAAPQAQPGWALTIINYYTNVSAGGDVSASRQATIGRFNPTVNINLNANLNANADLALVSPSYAFATPVLGGQLSLSMAGIVGRSTTSIDGTLTSALGPLTVTRRGSISDTETGFGDLYPQMALRWNSGVNNWMTYVMGDIPVGEYDPSHLANLGIGHGAVDGGVAYTYFNPQTGQEFSVATGVTYNLKNTYTDYQNGVDWHVDWGLSQFLSKQVQVGAVGYLYQQITADRGQPAILGDFKSRVAAIGPQVGFVIPAGSVQAYLNVKAYFEFDAQNRPSGWNGWVTLNFTPSAAQAAMAAPPIPHK